MNIKNYKNLRTLFDDDYTFHGYYFADDVKLKSL